MSEEIKVENLMVEGRNAVTVSYTHLVLILIQKGNQTEK